MTTPLHAGQHPVPLDEVHALMDHAQLLDHLAGDHDLPWAVPVGVARDVHRAAHDHVEAP